MKEAAPAAPSPAPSLKASWNANARTPVSKRKKVLLQPDFDISVRASSPAPCSGAAGIQISAACIDFIRSVSEWIVFQGRMSSVGLLTERAPSSCRGEKDIASHGPSFCKPAVRVPEQNLHASFPYPGNRLLCCKVKHILGPGPSAECWGRGSALEKPMGRDTHQSQGFLVAEIFILFV